MRVSYVKSPEKAVSKKSGKTYFKVSVEFTFPTERKANEYFYHLCDLIYKQRKEINASSVNVKKEVK